MTIVVTARASVPNDSTGVGLQSMTSASFTPSSSSKLYVIAWAQRTLLATTLDFTCTATHTGVGAFTRLEFPATAAWNGDVTFAGTIGLWEADVTTPSAGTVTVDWAAGTPVGIGAFQVFDVTGTGVAIVSGQRVANTASKAGGSSETHTSGTLPGTTTSGNTVIAALGVSVDAAGAATTPSGWTAVGTPTSAQYSTIGIWSHTTFAGTSVSWTDCGQLVGTAGAVVFELAETGGGGAASSSPSPIQGPGAVGDMAFQWAQIVGVGPSTTVAPVTQTLTGTVTPGPGTIVKAVTQTKAGSSTSAGAVAKAVTKPGLAGTITTVGTLAKLTAKVLAGSVASSGALASTKVVLQTLAGTITAVGALVKAVAKTLTGSSTPAGAVAKQDQKRVTGTVTPTGALVRAVSKLLAAAIAGVGILASTKVGLKTLTGTITPAGAVAKQDQKTVTGSSTPAGIIRIKAVTKTLAATVTPAATLVRAVSQRLVGTVTPAGALATNRILVKLLAGIISSAGAVVTFKSSGLPDENPQTATITQAARTAVAVADRHTTVTQPGRTATVRQADRTATGLADDRTATIRETT